MKKKIGIFAAPILALLLSGIFAAPAHAQGPPPPGEGPWTYGEAHGAWAPPTEFSEAAHHGYDLGIQSARHDIENHRSFNPGRHDVFKHPDVPPGPARRDYRMGFQRGYDRAFHYAGEWPPPDWR